MEQKGLFQDYRYCEICRRPLPQSFEGTVCPLCKEHALFMQVKDFIRENDVTEYEVAEKFNLPLSRIKQWIREGRIEYKDKDLNGHISYNCQRCGAPISFGTLCSKCLRYSNNMGRATVTSGGAPMRMRFLDSVENDN